MIVQIDKSFVKDTNKIHDKQLNQRIKDTIINVQEANTINSIKNIRKMEGHETFYRIRIGNYRMGIEIIDKKVIILCLKDRKDIYKYFPPR
jgi:mRNA interferase RelE/StbE